MNNDKKYIVYKHTSPDGKVYIGCTGDNIKHRWDNGRKYHHNKDLSSDIKKFGWDNFNHEILYSELDEEDAYLLERELIHKYDSCNPDRGYNKTHGGKRNPGMIRSDEYRKQLSNRMSGKAHPFYGKHFSEEHRRKISKANTGHVVSAETREKIGKANRENGRNKRKVFCVETGIIYDSIVNAANDVNTSATNIQSVCAGKTKTAAGYHWQYIE